MGCTLKQLTMPKIVAIATDKYLNSYLLVYRTNDQRRWRHTTQYGQISTLQPAGKAPEGHDVGSKEVDLKAKMEKLIRFFASNDRTGMNEAIVWQFLAKRNQVFYFDDTDLNQAAANHTNIKVLFVMRRYQHPPNQSLRRERHAFIKP